MVRSIRTRHRHQHQRSRREQPQPLSSFCPSIRSHGRSVHHSSHRACSNHHCIHTRGQPQHWHQHQQWLQERHQPLSSFCPSIRIRVRSNHHCSHRVCYSSCHSIRTRGQPQHWHQHQQWLRERHQPLSSFCPSIRIRVRSNHHSSHMVCYSSCHSIRARD